MTLKFVDVASHQENYSVGSSGEDGIIIKATQGTGYINPYMDFVAQQAISKGMPWGIYHYAGGGDAIAEADYFIQSVRGYLTGSNPPNLILDWEEYQNSAYQNGEWANTFLNHVKEITGLQAGVYGNSNDMAQMLASVYSTAWLWFAGYPTSQDVGWNPCEFPYSIGNFSHMTGWQFSSTPLDKSFFYVTTEEWNDLGSKNNGKHTINPTIKENSKMKPYIFNVVDADGEITGGTMFFDGLRTIAFAGTNAEAALNHIKGTYKQTTGEDLPTQTKTQPQFDLWGKIYKIEYIKF